MSWETLRNALLLPADVDLVDVHMENATDSVELHLAGPMMPEAKIGEMPREISYSIRVMNHEGEEMVPPEERGWHGDGVDDLLAELFPHAQDLEIRRPARWTTVEFEEWLRCG
jgi:hypothetical protein